MLNITFLVLCFFPFVSFTELKSLLNWKCCHLFNPVTWYIVKHFLIIIRNIRQMFAELSAKFRGWVENIKMPKNAS